MYKKSESVSRRRARLREARPHAVLYPAVDKALALRHAPPEVIALCVQRSCACCDTPLLPVAEALAQAEKLARRLGRRLVLICAPCLVAVRGRRPALAVEVACPQVMDLLQRHQAMKN